MNKKLTHHINSGITSDTFHTIKSVVFVVLVLCVIPFGLFAQEETLQQNTAAIENDIDASILDGDVSTTSLEEAQSRFGTTTPSSLLNVRPQSGADVPEDESLGQGSEQQAAIFSLFESRIVSEFSLISFMAYWVQQAAQLGIPPNTIVLILLTPIIATLVSFVRVIVGLPTLELLFPIALSFALVSVGITLGLIILSAVLIASYVSNVLLKRFRMMFFPKRSLSLLLLSLFVFASLTVAVYFDVAAVKNVSIFPVLIIMLLGDSVVSLQLHKSFSETFTITATTILIGLVGYLMATSVTTQLALLLYPEIILFTIPINILIGRYFGLRISEYFRFKVLNR